MKALLYFQSDRGAPTSLSELLLDLFQQILCTFLINSKIRIAGKTEFVNGKRFVSAEQGMDVMPDQIFN
ncbi:hypothetical protein D3C73_1039910 [compost metagenome]